MLLDINWRLFQISKTDCWTCGTRYYQPISTDCCGMLWTEAREMESDQTMSSLLRHASQSLYLLRVSVWILVTCQLSMSWQYEPAPSFFFWKPGYRTLEISMRNCFSVLFIYRAYHKHIEHVQYKWHLQHICADVISDLLPLCRWFYIIICATKIRRFSLI